MSENKFSPKAFHLLIAWILANMLGWFIGLGTAEILTILAARGIFPWPFDTDVAFAYISLVLLGVTIGIAQWMVIRHQLHKSAPWIPATIIGYLLSASIFAIANHDPDWLLRSEPVNNIILFGLMGIAIGSSQWLVLKRHFRRSGLWVIASTVGFISLIWLVVDPTRSLGELLIRTTLLGAFIGAVTGLTLVWMIRHLVAN